MPESVKDYNVLWENIQWESVAPRIGVACVIVIISMWLCSILVKKIAPFILLIVALAGCALVTFLIIDGRIAGKIEIGLAAGIIGSFCAVLALPALNGKKKE
ncbi:MAG: hypothetical protein ACRC37_01730 [Lentisphaeria bacterium]